MSSKPTGAGKAAQLKNKNKGVQGPPHYATHPMGTIKTWKQNTRDALSDVMSQLREKSGEKFLTETTPGGGAKPSTHPCEQVSDKSDDSCGLNGEVSHSLMGCRQPDVADSITKRRSQMGLLDTDSTSDSSLRKLWDNGGDIASRSYAEHEVDHHGVTFSTPDNDNICKNQFIIMHKCVDALQEEFVQVNRDGGQRLDRYKNANDDLGERLTVGLKDIDTKFSELMIDDMFVKMLQQGVEIMQTDLEEFKNVYSSFHEKAFTPLLGNVDTNSLCLNELGKDVTTIQEDVWSLTLKVHKMGQTLSSLEKGTNSGFSKLKPNEGNFQTTVLGFNDSCQEGEHSRLQGWGSPGKDGPSVSQNMARTMDTL